MLHRHIRLRCRAHAHIWCSTHQWLVRHKLLLSGHEAAAELRSHLAATHSEQKPCIGLCLGGITSSAMQRVTVSAQISQDASTRRQLSADLHHACPPDQLSRKPAGQTFLPQVMRSLLPQPPSRLFCTDLYH